MTVLQKNSGEEKILTVKLDKGNKPSFGICIVRGEVKDAPSSKVTGIFIKDIVPQSPAALCGKLKIGDRILSLNDNDVRNATEQIVIDLIRGAGSSIVLEIQTIDISNSSSAPTENGYSSNTAQNAGDSPEGSDDDDDTRDMTGRMYTEAGWEIDRASAGNVKRSKAEMKADPETEDEFGYTTNKIKKRYGSLGAVHKTEVTRPPNADLGLAISGHKDRTKMACMVAGVNPNGIVGSANLKPGDEILEVNGNVLKERCHLNASVIFKNLPGEKVVFVVLRNKSNQMAVKPVHRFPVSVDETEYLFTAYKNVRKVQMQKTGVSLGIMIIEGKHVEVGSGIFISDIQEDSNAMKAGLQVGEIILAINKDVMVDSTYDNAADILKRAQGVVTLVVANLKSEEQIAAEIAEKKRQEEKKNAPPEPEKPQDPSTAVIKTNSKTLIEIKVEKKPLGCIVAGGKNGFVTTGCVITHIFPDGVFAKDNRLQIFDHIIEFNGNPVNTKEMTVHKVHQLFYLQYEKITMMVWRNDPPEMETVNVELTRKPGKDLGMAMAAGPKGVVVTEVTSAGCADVDGRIQRGDIINKLNGDSLEGASFAESCALFRAAAGRVSFEILRPKPTLRT